MKSMSVVARWRPLEQSEATQEEVSRTTTSIDKDGRALSSVSITRQATTGPSTKNLQNPSWTSPAAFREIFNPDDDNKCVYDAVVAPALPHVLNGGRSSLFAYGHSGSGKTHTIIGYDGKDEAGLCLLAAQQLFEAITALQFVRDTKKSAFDLLNEHKECHVRQGADGKVHIRGETEMLEEGKVRVCPIVQRCCWSYEALRQDLTKALAGRAVGSSSVHDQSSRTHAILELEIICSSLVEARQAVVDRQSELVPVGKRATDITLEEQIKGIVLVPGGGWAPNPDYKVNQERIDAVVAEKNAYEARVVAAEGRVKAILNDRLAPCLGGAMVFVDLAGAEYHHDKTAPTKGQRQHVIRQTPQERQEGQQINTDLLALKEVMRAWSADQPRIPFRSSTLTMVLRDHFMASEGGHSTMIVTVSPSITQYAATLNSLKYGSLVGVARAQAYNLVNERSPSQDTITTTTTAATTETDTTATTAGTMDSHGTNSTAALDDSPALVPDVLFSTVKALFKQLAAVPADCDSLVVGKVSVESFRKIEAERDRRERHYRLLFIPDIKCVMITIPTGRHERAHLSLFALVSYAMRDMGLQHQWAAFGAETLAALGGISAAGQGEGDSSGGPRLRRDGSARAWPTLVVEAGATQTLPSLRMRARWWFTASDYAMKVVVLVKLISATCSIQIEKWITAVPRPQCQGATNTRASRAGRQPVMDQRVLINWVGPAPLPQTPLAHRALAHFAVEGAPLVLRFHELMDRQPLTAAGEHDVSLSEADLQDLAQQVWDRT